MSSEIQRPLYANIGNMQADFWRGAQLPQLPQLPHSNNSAKLSPQYEGNHMSQLPQLPPAQQNQQPAQNQLAQLPQMPQMPQLQEQREEQPEEPQDDTKFNPDKLVNEIQVSFHPFFCYWFCFLSEVKWVKVGQKVS